MFPPDDHFSTYRATGDAAAFRALVESHLGMVLVVAQRRLGPHGHLAADVAQAVFSRLARAAAGLPDDLVPAAWLHRQTVRLSIDAVRREERRRARESAAAMFHESCTPSELSAAESLLDEALDQLPAMDRALLMLRYYEDRDLPAVATALRTTPEAARKRIARSLERLRGLLGRRGAVLSATALAALLEQQPAHAFPPALAASVTTGALQSAAAGKSGAVLTAFIMSSHTALVTGAAAALLASAWVYLQRESSLSPGGRALPEVSIQAPGNPRSAVPAAVVAGTDAVQSAAEMPSPEDLPEIIRRLARITAGADTETARLLSARLLRLVPPKSYQRFFEEAEKSIHPARWLRVVQQASEEWIRVSPDALTKALFASDSNRPDLNRRVGTNGEFILNSLVAHGLNGGPSDRRLFEAFGAWLQRDAESAAAWFRSTSSSPLMKWGGGFASGTMRIGAELEEMIVKHLASASAGDGLSGPALSGMAQSHAEELKRERARLLLEKTGGLEFALRSGGRPAADVRLIASEQALQHADECRKWVEGAIAAGNAHAYDAAVGLLAQDRAMTLSGETKIMHSPDTAERLQRAGLVLSAGADRPAEQVMDEVVRAWTSGRFSQGTTELYDLLAAQSGSVPDNVLETGARELHRDQQSGEALQWAARIQDPARREALLRGLFVRWHDISPAHTAQYLKSAPPELAAELRSFIQPGTP